MQWHKIIMSSKQVATGKHGELHDDFEKIFISLKGPQDMALFEEYGSSGCTYYISPSSINYVKHLIEKYSGVPCEHPKPNTLIPIIINEAWKAGPEKDLLITIP